MGMTALNSVLCLCLALVCISYAVEVKYKPTWESLDSRPLPAWYDEAKIGIFIVWGVYSVPSFSTEWFWYQWKGSKLKPVVDFMEKNYRPDFTYPDFAPMFTAEFYNPKSWVDMISASGAKYVVFSTKHCDGFTNWPSNVSFNWNSMDVGPKRDLVGELADAIRAKGGIHLGLYHSLLEWFHPLYLKDMANNFTTQDFVRNKALPALYELVKTYKPDVIWSDGDWETLDTYWNATEFLAWLYNESPVKDTVAVNDRWGKNIRCKHGGFWNCEDKHNPGVLMNHKWENCMTLDKNSWGYRRLSGINDYLTMDELTTIIAETISCGGNILINVGPTKEGIISPVFEERLRQMGQWLSVNGEAIYSSKPWSHQKDKVTSGVWYTSKKTSNGTAVYAIVLDWPRNNVLTLAAPVVSNSTVITMLGYPTPFKWSRGWWWQDVVDIQIPNIPINKMPCQWAWVFKLTGLKN